jgi:tripartite-type tricarboxylate transporter receptor subunit TctC
VGYAAGGPADTVARLTAQWLSDRLGQQVVVENRAGAASNIAAEAVVRSPPDGYTLLYVTVSNAVNVTLYNKLSFDLMRDLVPIASITRSPGVLEVNPSFPAQTLPEFIEPTLQCGLVASDHRAQQGMGELAPDGGTDLRDLPHRG